MMSPQDDVDHTTGPNAQRPVHEASLTVLGSLDSLGSIAEYVMQVAAEAGLSRRMIYHLRLAVDEIATNIVTHGYQANGLSGQIEVRARVDETAVTIVLEDTSPAYDPTFDQEPLSMDLPVQERPIGGLGMYLAAQNVDKLTYERIGNRNRHTFVVMLPEKQP
jgi:serine/threonine-protein kinase RsbW